MRGREIEEGQCWSELHQRRRGREEYMGVRQVRRMREGEWKVWCISGLVAGSGERRGFTVVVARGKEDGDGEDKRRVKPLVVVFWFCGGFFGGFPASSGRI
ncbi:hypothetical protein HAX54_000074 [Datura stramonium]|uniref:Uncharacterized protein n=1 Tax=Datura stramonium TaxID=4076 RepID=A0ABS8RIG2_DATST|nr:hypothetical protein [Datura stramonium]